MSIILKGTSSWYSATDRGGNSNVAMMSARTCTKCGGCGYIHIECGCGSIEQCTALNEKCLRCGGDGKLINQMPFTGLKDKNGKEIYEGNTCKGRGTSLYFVQFENGQYWLKNVLTKKIEKPLTARIAAYMEVLVSIHDKGGEA